jgi:rubrerythrin
MMDKKTRKKIDKAIIWINRNIASELKIIRFYEENLHVFSTKHEMNAVKKLVTESLQHAKTLIDAKHRLESLMPKKPSSLLLKSKLKVLREAMKEEKAMEDLYRHEASKVGEKKIARVFAGIAKMEVDHQKIVRSLSVDAAKALSAGKARSMLKKMRLI